jgi:uncharacterized membrane protein YfcA
MDPTTGALQTLGTAGLVITAVAILNNYLSLTRGGKLLSGAITAVGITLIWSYANQPINWPSVPLVALTSWLSAMGGASGGKTVKEISKS